MAYDARGKFAEDSAITGRVKYDIEYNDSTEEYRFKGKPVELISILQVVAPEVFFDSSNSYEPKWVDFSTLNYNYGNTVFFDVSGEKNFIVLDTPLTGDCLSDMNNFVNNPA